MTSMRVMTVGEPDRLGRQVAGAMDVSPETVKALASFTDAWKALSDVSSTPDAIVIGPAMPAQECLEFAEDVSVSFPSTITILMREAVSEALFPAAMRSGVRDVVDTSRGDGELVDALARAQDVCSQLHRRHDAQAGPGGRLVSVFSSKGGTGKTFLSSNLAAAASMQGLDTALVDMDLSMGDVFTYFGTESQTAMADLVSFGHHSERDARSLGTSLHEHLWGFGAAPDPSVGDVSAERVTELLEALKASFEFTVVDLPSSYSDLVLATLDASDVVLLVASLDVVSTRHLAKAIDTLVSINIPRERLRIVLNRADSKVGIRPDDVEAVLGTPLDACLPSTRAVPTSLNRGMPIFFENPKAEIAQKIADLAREIVGAVPKQESKGHGPLGRFLSRV